MEPATIVPTQEITGNEDAQNLPSLTASLDEEFDDADMATVETGPSSSTSITDSILNYRTVQGRTYQNSKTAEYWAPNDKQQNEGLDILHNGLTMLLENKLFVAPIDKKPVRVLDIGTGTGIWAIDFADAYPESEVIGTDISPIQPAWVPENLSFVIEDMNLNWTWSDSHFDFIHLRVLYGCVTDWAKLYEQSFCHLKPGGWVQHLEMDTKLESDHVNFEEQSFLDTWAELFVQAGEKMGRPFDISRGHRMKDLLEPAGFTDVVEKKIKMPCGGWPKDPRLKQLGFFIQAALLQSLDGLAMYIGTQVMGWSVDEVTVLVSKVRKEVERTSNCSYVTT